jgi:acetyltransferase-like isoleucine patch superfamily enzyme
VSSTVEDESVQVLRDLKSCWEYMKNRGKYPGCKVAFGCRVSGNTFLGAGARIESECRIDDCEVGGGAFLAYGSSAAHCKVGQFAGVHRHSQLSNVEIGDYSYVAERCNLAKLSIGKFCSIGPELMCGYGVHPLEWLSTSPVFYSIRGQAGKSFADRNYFQEDHLSSIGHDVWIGARVFIKDGVSIGNGAIVAAGAVVTTDVAPYCIVGGVPAKIIRYRFDDTTIGKLQEIEWWNWPEDELRSACDALRCNNINELNEWIARKQELH